MPDDENSLAARRARQAAARADIARRQDPDQEPDPVVDFDSRRQARETESAIERAEQQRRRLAESRATHAPLTREQSAHVTAHRNDTTARAEAHRNKIRIANCNLCDTDGYRGATVCDHIDRTETAKRGMALVRAALRKAGR